MVTALRLRKAPIIEAIIDIRVRLSHDFEITEYLESLKNEIYPQYKKIEQRTAITGSIQIKDGKPKVRKGKSNIVNGYRFTSANKKNVVQMRIDGFTFSRLKPYSNWESVSSEATRLWLVYSNYFRPQQIEKLSLQYINRIDMPFGSELEDYLTYSPKLPKALPQGIIQMFSKISVEEKGFDIDITQTNVKSSKAGHVGVILDINVRKERKNNFTEKTIWAHFDKMRIIKNKVFFNLVKEKALRMYS